MITPIQTASYTGGTATISPLHVWDNLSQAAQAQIAARTYSSSITTLGASAASVAPTYGASGLLQIFAPVISASGLNKAQQQDLAKASGLNASSTNTDVLNALNALLMPADASQVLVNVLVGSAAAATEAGATTPSLLSAQGEIQGTPVDLPGQAAEATFAATLDLGATATVASNTQTVGTQPAANLNPATATNPATAEAPVATAGPVAAETVAVSDAATPIAPAPITTQVPAPALATPPAATATAPVAATNATAVNAVATTTTGSAVTTAVATTPPAAVTLATPPATATAAAVSSPAIAIAATGTPPAVAVATAAVAATTSPYANTAGIVTVTEAAPSIPAGNVVPTPVGITAAEIVAATEAAQNIPAGNVTPAYAGITAAEIAAVTEAAQNIPAGNVTPASVGITAAGANLVATQAAVAAPALAESGAAAVVTAPAPAALAASTAPAATIPSTIPVIRFDNADSLLQSLLAEAAAHAMIQRYPASATYGVGGAWFQMGAGTDHVPRSDLKGYLPDTPDIVRPVSRVASTRGATERQT